MNYLLHTDVLKAAIEGSLSAPLRALLQQTPPTHLHLSVLALAEVLKTVSAPETLAWLRRIPAEYADRLLPVDAAIAVAYAELTARVEENGQSLDFAPGMAAATALRHDLILVTNPTPALLACGVRIWNQEA